MQNLAHRVSGPWEHPQALVALTSISALIYPQPFGPGALFKLRSLSLVLTWATEYAALCPALLPAGPDVFVGLTAWPQPWLPPQHLSDDHEAEPVTAANPAWSCGTAPLLVKPLSQPVPRSPLVNAPSCSSPGFPGPCWSAPLVTSLQLMAMFLLMQSNMRFAFTAERVHCWLMLNLLSTRTFQIILYRATF